MNKIEQAAVDRATWPALEAGPVMQALRRGIAVAVDEAETGALIEECVAPDYVPLDFGRHGVRLLPQPRAERAWRKLAELRGERVTGAQNDPQFIGHNAEGMACYRGNFGL